MNDPIFPEANHHRRAITVRRNREPPRNDDGNIICEHADCQDDQPTFRLPSQWNKHMDRHERPYKCFESGCEEKLAFVSSGDYLRHQREVHDSGRKPRYSKFCPSEGCRRHISEPFARTENLREHIRRMHKSEANSYLELRERISAEPSTQKNASLGPHGVRDPATCLSHDNILQMEADSLRDIIMEKDRRIQELERQTMELEATNHGPQN
ncbi:hypothetical protein N7481_001532 [Penicillium waksmanii]|uniref:uncharacterized protein n=1 Tax=Penicillium waksmanii TaxID=69791 RepID=UPI002549599C|nr:uncharacterized protein N7481_001532 [Penicillium waksmanii]KAJ6001123.1 hypothetical protein N7481_001532 [Penicillium waksmanii]